MALASKTARLALGSAVIDAQYLADSVIFMNSKYGVQGNAMPLVRASQ